LLLPGWHDNIRSFGMPRLIVFEGAVFWPVGGVTQIVNAIEGANAAISRVFQGVNSGQPRYPGLLRVVLVDEEFAYPRIAVAAEQFFGTAFGAHHAGIEKQHLVGNVFGQEHVVGHAQHGDVVHV